MKETLNSKLYILVVIGIVSAFGPFVTDFYLPALPGVLRQKQRLELCGYLSEEPGTAAQ